MSYYPKLRCVLYHDNQKQYTVVLAPGPVSSVGPKILCDHSIMVSRREKVEYAALTFTLGDVTTSFTHTFIVNRFEPDGITLGMDFLRQNGINYDPSKTFIETENGDRIQFIGTYDKNVTIEAYTKFDGIPLACTEDIKFAAEMQAKHVEEVNSYVLRKNLPLSEQPQKEVRIKTPIRTYDATTQTNSEGYSLINEDPFTEDDAWQYYAFVKRSMEESKHNILKKPPPYGDRFSDCVHSRVRNGKKAPSIHVTKPTLNLNSVRF